MQNKPCYTSFIVGSRLQKLEGATWFFFFHCLWCILFQKLTFFIRNFINDFISCYFINTFSLFLIQQTNPVSFAVQAVVTNSDMEFDVQEIDFGHCTVYESVCTTIQLTNKSILPQHYGFLGLPEVRMCAQWPGANWFMCRCFMPACVHTYARVNACLSALKCSLYLHLLFAFYIVRYKHLRDWLSKY